MNSLTVFSSGENLHCLLSHSQQILLDQLQTRHKRWKIMFLYEDNCFGVRSIIKLNSKKMSISELCKTLSTVLKVKTVFWCVQVTDSKKLHFKPEHNSPSKLFRWIWFISSTATDTCLVSFCWESASAWSGIIYHSMTQWFSEINGFCSSPLSYCKIMLELLSKTTSKWSAFFVPFSHFIVSLLTNLILLPSSAFLKTSTEFLDNKVHCCHSLSTVCA